MQENKNWQRLEAVIRWANMSTNYFALHIGLSRGENLYQIKRGNNGISLNLAERIVKHFPEINKLWLLTGDGEMIAGAMHSSLEVPFYRVDAERAIRQVAQLEPECMLGLPLAEKCDLAMVYSDAAMGRQLPAGTIVFLREVAPDALIPGKEYLVCSAKFDALRVVRTAEQPDWVRLVAGDRKNYDDMLLLRSEIERVYAVCAKLTINQ
ncbi:MAG: hypothetical protein IKU77_02225 [Alistipes sp.]|nr:hypothetical protein [Alistipes sp.]